MVFTFLKDEVKEALDLIKSIFVIKIDEKDFNLLANQKVLLLKIDDEVVGTTIITLKHDPIKNINTYFLDYFCIKAEYQHQGLGRKMFEEINRIAKEENIDYIELTSRKEREVARKMYLDLGMTIKDTDLFIKKV